MLKLSFKDFRVVEVEKVDLGYKPMLGDHVEQISAQQQLLYTANQHVLLLIVQAMDAAGKEGRSST